MKALTDKVLAFVRENPKRAWMLGIGACLCLAALILALCFAVAGGEEEPSFDISVPEGAVSASDWPESDLLNGIPEPNEGKVVAVYQTDRTVAVFLEEFPSNALQPYLEDTGLKFKSDAPYIATADGKTVAVMYSASDGRLSITVIS